ncbi:phytoene desaturase [Pseudoroseicyclus aestuarii]|uniref:Phytoene desaturase n=1 Tax=Pseudoroseicyclus aestuarii TaxID=1795041 RepID=A0A318SZU9_9RHOB|nr:phytoene desaturase family protein [Pseudoroseicyclus aestuarii]PYE85956.1 phytoene desaturase [Pseudoroseicyclus aestuarii]
MMLQKTDHKRVVIVGAGPGGLATAMLLRAAGADVTVIERADRVGGRTAAIEQDGFTFDVGPTFFLYPESLEAIFAACGRHLWDEVELTRLDPMYRLQFDDGVRFEATADVDALAEQVAVIDKDDARNVRAYLDANRAKFDSFLPILRRPFLGLRDILRGDMLRALPNLRPWSGVDADLGRWFKNPDVRLAFSFQSKYLGMSPFKCPSLFTILAHVEYGFGVWHPTGGCNQLTRAMARVATEMGVEIRLSEPVTALSFEGRRVTGATTDHGHYPCDALVMNADFAQAMRTLVPDNLRRRWTDAKIEAKQYSCSTFMLYLGLEGEFPDMHHHTIYMSSDYAENVREIDAGLAPEEPTIYVQNGSVTDPTLAPEGHTALYVLVPVGNLTGGVDWQALAPAYREKILDRVARLTGRDVRPLIRTEVMFTPEDWQAQAAVFRGATFNLAHNLGQMLHLRPRNRFEDLDGVYLTGGGTHPGSGLPTIFESAKIASTLVAEDLNLPEADVPAHTLTEAAE